MEAQRLKQLLRTAVQVPRLEKFEQQLDPEDKLYSYTLRTES